MLGGAAAQHSQSLEARFAHVLGLKVVILPGPARAPARQGAVRYLPPAVRFVLAFPVKAVGKIGQVLYEINQISRS